MEEGNGAGFGISLTLMLTIPGSSERPGCNWPVKGSSSTPTGKRTLRSLSEKHVLFSTQSTQWKYQAETTKRRTVLAADSQIA
jgi:hypothetical protein